VFVKLPQVFVTDIVTVAVPPAASKRMDTKRP
jgi:hypothetical protein